MIVFERTGAWAAALRRVLGGAIELRSTRSLAECRRELADARQSLVAVELTADSAPQVAEFIVWANEQMAPAQVVVLASGDERDIRRAGNRCRRRFGNDCRGRAGRGERELNCSDEKPLT